MAGDNLMTSSFIHSEALARKAVGEFRHPVQYIPAGEDVIEKNITILPSLRMRDQNQEGMFSCQMLFINVRNSREDILNPKPRGSRKTLGQQGTTQCALECYGAGDSEKRRLGGGGREKEAKRVSNSGKWLNPCLDRVWLYKFLCISPGEEQRQLFVLLLPGYGCDGSCCSQGEDRKRFLWAYNPLL